VTETPGSTDTTGYGVTVWEWLPLVRRARIPGPIKLGLLVVGSYASAAGTEIYCGVARLAVDCGVSYRTASRYLAWGRDHQLIELVKRGNRRLRQADEYRLIAGPDLHRLVDIPTEEEYRVLVAAMAADNRTSTRDRARRRSTATPDDPESGPSSTDTYMSVGTRFLRTPDASIYGHLDVRPPVIGTPAIKT